MTSWFACARRKYCERRMPRMGDERECFRGFPARGAGTQTARKPLMKKRTLMSELKLRPPKKRTFSASCEVRGSHLFDENESAAQLSARFPAGAARCDCSGRGGGGAAAGVPAS